MKTLVALERMRLLLLFGRYRVFARKFVRSSMRLSFDQDLNVDEDVFSGIAYRRSQKLALDYLEKYEDLTESFVNPLSLAILRRDGTADLLGKRALLAELCFLFQSAEFARSAVGSGNGNTLLGLERFSPRVWRHIKANNPDFSDLTIPLISVLRQYVQLSFGLLIAVSFILLAPLCLLFAARLNGTSVREVAIACAQEDAFEGTPICPTRLLVESGQFDRSDIVFFSDSRARQKWPRAYRKSGHYMSETLLSLARRQSVFWHIANLVNSATTQIDFLRAVFLCPVAWREVMKEFHQFLFWTLFLASYRPRKVIKMMVSDSLTASATIRAGDGISTFLYLSATERIIKKGDISQEVVAAEYCYMAFDQMISCSVSNKRTKALSCRIAHYIDLGPITSQLVRDASPNKRRLRMKAGINEGRKVVSFFDTKVGYKGMCKTTHFVMLCETMLYLANQHPEWAIIFKPKSNWEQLVDHPDSEVSRAARKVRFSANVIDGAGLELDQFEVLAMSDCVVTLPASSVFYEAAGADLATLIFDPEGRYNSFDMHSKRFSNLWAQNTEMLEAKIVALLDNFGKTILQADLSALQNEMMITRDGNFLDKLGIILGSDRVHNGG